jgi:hypothetical protein
MSAVLDTNHYAACQGRVVLLQLEKKDHWQPPPPWFKSNAALVNIYLDQMAAVVSGEHISVNTPCRPLDSRPVGSITFSDNNVIVDLIDNRSVPPARYRYNGSYEMQTTK